jgi:branched-subunit amino acid aminotransferase/4-amino-4-deoxychorismate lyase
MRVIDSAHYLDALAATRQSWQTRYYAMYSSILDGVVVDPVLMQVPVDDHLVHRGDGVFDTFKCVARGAYNLDPHLKRLIRSAGEIALVWPGGIQDIRDKVLQTLSIADKEDCSCRVIVARGPGGLGVSPYESPRPALYIIVYAAGTPFMKAHPEGARVNKSSVPVKAGNFATYKHCNYLSNVLMKREAIDAGVDFVVSYDVYGFLAEGATENVGIVTPDRELLFPGMDYVLDGTTMLRVMALAEPLVAEGALKRVAFANITEAMVRSASELLIIGTTLNVASACTYEGEAVGDACPGPIGRRLDHLLAKDIVENEEMRTRY